MDYNYTTFYTEGFGKHLCTCYGIISLNMGDKFIVKGGNVYEIVYKMFNAASIIMIYQGKLICEGIQESN